MWVGRGGLAWDVGALSTVLPSALRHSRVGLEGWRMEDGASGTQMDRRMAGASCGHFLFFLWLSGDNLVILFRLLRLHVLCSFITWRGREKERGRERGREKLSEREER